MPHRNLDSSALARLLVATMLGAVMSFLLVSVVARVRARRIDDDVEAITASAMPSVRDLSAARGALHHLDAYADRVYESAQRGAPLSAAPVDAHLEALRATVAAYLALPTSDGAGQAGRDVAASVADVDRGVPTMLSALDRSDRATAEAALTRLHADIERLDATLERLIERNATEGAERGLDVRQVRRGTARTVLMLDLLVAALTLGGTALAIVMLRRSVGSLEQANRDAVQRVSWLEERSSELDRFAGRVAHDVLSPLSSAGLALGMLRRRYASDAEAQAIAGRGLRGIAQSKELALGLLELARAGARPGSGERADLTEAIDVTVSLAREGAAADGTEIRVDAFPPSAVACSPAVIASILGNLVRNALKHMGDAPTRVVRVGVSGGDGVLRVEVEDTGPGVPAALVDTIFEPFVRGPTGAPGVGLGLATVKQLVASHGGRVGVTRGRLGGSLFWFELPEADAHRSRSGITERASSSA